MKIAVEEQVLIYDIKLKAMRLVFEGKSLEAVEAFTQLKYDRPWHKDF